MEVSKSDWKLFRARIGDWQEAYMERLVKEYMDLLVSAENASDKFWKLEERIKKADLEGFSDKLRESVDFLSHS